MITLVKKPWSSLKNELKEKWEQLIATDTADGKRPSGHTKKSKKRRARSARNL